MKISAGILIVKDGKILLGHVTGSPRFDIPKGLVDEGENPKETAIRECQEEFGIKVPGNELVDLGEFKYLSGKKLHLFRWDIDEFPRLSSLKCTSFFTARSGRELPEIDGYNIFKIEEAMPKVAKGLGKIIEDLFLKKESLFRKVLDSVKEELSVIAGKPKSHEELMANRAIPLYLPMMKRLGYSYSGEKAFHLTNDRHLEDLYKIQKTDKQLSTFTIGGPELMRLPSQPNCLVVLEGTEVIRGKSDIWTTVDKNGMRWINHNVEERSTKFMLTFMIDGILTKIFKDFGVDFSTEGQSSNEILKMLKKTDTKKFYKEYLKSLEKWLDSGGYKEFGKYLDNAAEMKYNEVILTRFTIKGVYSLDIDNPKVQRFCDSKGIDYLGKIPSRALSELKI